MESDLLPLMEIAEEDDSLIQMHPDRNQTPSKSSLNYFPCSPFALPTSHSKSLKDGVHMEKPSSSSSETSNNKENINSNNVEVPKLGMEPMQMKRRKKGGGYNLRKSLAWDRAFLTDEGILDPLELTLITGINANTCGGGLPTISEEGNSSFSSDTKCTNESSDTEACEEVPLNKLDDKGHILKGNREKAGYSAGNHNSIPYHKVMHKILSIDRMNRAGSVVGGCSEPLAASSLKRPAMPKIANKECKLPKLPMSKPGSCLSAMTRGSVTASQLRHTLIPKPNAKKSGALKSSVKNVHGSQSKAKMGSGSLRLPVKELAQKTVRNMTNTNSSLKVTSSTKSRSVLVDKANSGSEMFPDRLQLCEIQEGSAPLARKNLVQHTATKLKNPLPEAARLTGPGPCQIQRASNGLMMSDKLHPCESQELPTTLEVSHDTNLGCIGAYPPNVQPARPSGLRLPSPSLRFFDQKTALESGSLQQKKIQWYNASMGSNRKIGELRPPVAPENIIGNVCSAPSTHNYLGNTIEGVPSSENEVLKVIEQEKRILGHEKDMEMEKNARKGDEEMKLSHPTEQLGENNGGIHSAGNVGCNNNVGHVGTCQLMAQGHNDRVAFVPETEGNFLLHNEEVRVSNHTNISMSSSGQCIQHQGDNILSEVDGSTNFMQDLAQTSREQADTEKSDDPKVNPVSHLDADSLEAEDQASQVFAESRKDAIGKRDDDVGATKLDSPCLESNCLVLQSENIGQENEVYRSSPVEDGPRCYTDSPCSKKGRISIMFQNGGNIDAIELKGIDTMMDTSHTMTTEQGNGDAEVQLEFQEVDPLIDSNLSNFRPKDELITGTASLDDDAFLKTESVLEVARCATTYPQSLEKEEVDIAADTTEVESKIHEENQKIPCSEKGSISIRFQNGGNMDAVEWKGTVTMDTSHIPFQDLNTVQGNGNKVLLEFREVGPLIDDNNHSIHSNLRPEVELISGTASLEDDAVLKTESVLEVVRCASTYPDGLEKEGVEIAAATTEAELKIYEENQKSQEMGMIIGSLSEKSIAEANPTIQGCRGGLESYNQFQSENQTLEVSGTISKFPEMHLQDAQVQLLDDDTSIRSCRSLTSVLHNHSIGNADHSDIFEEQSEFSDTDIKLEWDSKSNHQLLSNTDNVQQECVYKMISNVVDQTDVYECDPKPSNIIIHSPHERQTVGLDRNNVGQPCVEYGTSGPAVIDSIAEDNGNGTDKQFTYNTKCGNLSCLLEFEKSNDDETIGVNPTRMECCSAGEESCSFPEKVADSIVEEMPTQFGAFLDVGQGSADNDQVFMKDSLSPEKLADLETPANSLDSIIVVPEQSISHGCDLKEPSDGAQILTTVQGNFPDLTGQSGYAMESSGQDPSESNSNFPMSQHLTAVSRELCSVSGRDKCLQTSTFSIGGEGSKMSFGEELETEVLLEGKSPMVAEFHHELDSGGGLKNSKEAAALIKKSNNIKLQDNSLVIHPPNAVPFSDEWLAAMEAAGEEILTMKCGAVQHSPPDKSLPEPSPWSPVKKKANQIGPYDCTKYTNALPPNPH